MNWAVYITLCLLLLAGVTWYVRQLWAIIRGVDIARMPYWVDHLSYRAEMRRYRRQMRRQGRQP